MLDIAGQQTSWLELAAFATGLLSVWLVKQAHIANWPLGLVNVLCFAVLFAQARLYASAALQVAFLLLGLYGWWNWRRLRGGAAGALPVTRMSRAEAFAGGAATLAATAACAAFLQLETDNPAPWADSAVLALSLLATWAQARGRIEHWGIWILVDVISIPLYAGRGLLFTAALYGLFLVICILGLRDWSRRLAPAGARA